MKKFYPFIRISSHCLKLILLVIILLRGNTIIFSIDFVDQEQKATKCIDYDSVYVYNIESVVNITDAVISEGVLPAGLTLTFDNPSDRIAVEGIPTSIETQTFKIEITYMIDGNPTPQILEGEFELEIININAGGPGEVCQGDNYTVSGVEYESVSFNWTTNGQGSFTDDDVANPTYESDPDESGDKNLTLEISNFGCTANANHVVTVHQKPDPPATGGNKEICDGETIPALTATGSDLKWYSDEALTNLVGSGSSYTPAVSGVGVYPYFITQTANNCPSSPSSDTIKIYSVPPPPDPAPDPSDNNKEICFGNINPTFEATGSDIEWFSDPGLTASIGLGSTYTPPASVSAFGIYTYYATQTVNICQSSATTFTLEIKSKPSPPGDQDLSEEYTGNDYIINVSGSNIKWYDNPAATSSIYTGNSYTLSSPGIGTYTYYVTQTENGCESEKSTINLAITRPNADVILVLDKSGSMRSNAPTTTTSKWDILNEAVVMFLDKYHFFGVPDDQIGTVLFNHTLIVLEDGAGNELMDLSETNNNIIKNAISPPIAGGLTAIGGGLQEGINILELENNTDPKNIILFTDGMQNRNLWLDYVAPGSDLLKIIDNQDKPDPDPTMPPDEQTILNTDLNIRIYTIGVGAEAGSNFEKLLQDVATGTGADYRMTVDPQSDLEMFFTEQFVNTLSIGSPQLVDYRHGQLSGNTYAEIFNINKSPDKLYIKVLFDRNTELDLEVHKSDLILSEHAELMKSGDFYKVFKIKFPYITNNQVIEAAGEWRCKISGSPGTKYKIAALVDDHTLDYSSSIGPEYLMAGDRIKLKTELKYNGQPVTNNKNIKAYLLKPGEDIGKLLSRTSVKDRLRKRKIILSQDSAYIQAMKDADTLLRDYNTDTNIKLKLLLDNPEILERLLPKTKKVKLEHTGNGIFEGRSGRCKIQGSYRILFRIEGTDEEIGDYYRVDSKSAMVNLADPSLFRSQIRIIPADPSTHQPVKLYLRPRDKFGNYLGPGYSEHLKITISNGTASVIQEQLDGSYIIPLDQVSDINTAKINISVQDRTLLDLDMSKVKKGLPWWMPKMIKEILNRT